MPIRVRPSHPDLATPTAARWPLRRLALASLVATIGVWGPGLAQAYCDEADAVAGAPAGRPALPDTQAFSASELFDGPAQGDGMTQLASLAREAVQASYDVRSAEHGSRAARQDLKQIEAGSSPQISVNGTVGVGQSTIAGRSQSAGGVGSAGVNATAPLYDGGRLDALKDYRQRLVSASDEGIGNARERAVREALLTVIDRNRFRLQLKVHGQQVAKLSCLARSIEQIVARDKGRNSELIQARKGVRQAEIARDEVQALLRQADARLRKVVGDNVAPWGAVGVPLIELPSLDTLLAQVPESPEIRSLRLQAEALDRLSRANAAEGSPQVRWQVGANSARQAQVNSSSWNAGVAVNMVLDDGGAVNAAASASRERAEATRRAMESGINERSKAIGTFHDAARSAYLRARHYAGVLQESDQLRNATFEQWSKLGRRSLFDLISAENEHYQLRIAYINALHDGFSASAQLRNASAGLLPWVAPELAGVPPAR
ncbi:TolC family protein [Leptothrix sp. BB-4]